MATHSSLLAWRIPWTEEPGGLQSTGPESDPTECAGIVARNSVRKGLLLSLFSRLSHA